jgi:enamine deaminase RidA (YjgF/YER057c/UK114 family)
VDPDPEIRLRELGLALPDPPRPAGNYAAALEVGGFVYLSGQFPFAAGRLLHPGRVGAELTVEEGYAAARLAALNALAQLKRELRDFRRLTGLVHVAGHVASAPGWSDAPRVLDGASDLFVAVLGARGRHTRAAFVPAALPFNAAIELVVVAAVSAPKP